MNILFTKKFVRKVIAEKLEGACSFDCQEMIRIFHYRVEPFDLKDKSLIFTSVNAVDSFFENGFLPCEDFSCKRFNKIYCVGKKTKKRLREHGFGTFKEKKHAKDLADFIIKHAQKEKFLHFCGNLALDVLNENLPMQNISYKKIPVYETKLLYPKVKGSYDGLVFFSPSGVRSYAKYNSLENKVIFSIGQTTAGEIKKFTNQPVHSSYESNIDDLLNVIYKKCKAMAV